MVGMTLSHALCLGVRALVRVDFMSRLDALIPSLRRARAGSMVAGE